MKIYVLACVAVLGDTLQAGANICHCIVRKSSR